MDKIDSNPARINGPLGATYSYGRKKLSTGSEIAAAPTADGGVLTFIRDQQHSTMWTGRAVAGGGSWAPLCRAPFPMFATAGSMVRTSSGVLVMAGQFPIVSLEVSWDDGATLKLSSAQSSRQTALPPSCRIGLIAASRCGAAQGTRGPSLTSTTTDRPAATASSWRSGRTSSSTSTISLAIRTRRV